MIYGHWNPVHPVLKSWASSVDKHFTLFYSLFFFLLTEFHGLEEWMLLRSLQALQAEGKAEIITMDDGKGVKFFWAWKGGAHLGAVGDCVDCSLLGGP